MVIPNIKYGRPDFSAPSHPQCDLDPQKGKYRYISNFISLQSRMEGSKGTWHRGDWKQQTDGTNQGLFDMEEQREETTKKSLRPKHEP